MGLKEVILHEALPSLNSRLWTSFSSIKLYVKKPDKVRFNSAAVQFPHSSEELLCLY